MIFELDSSLYKHIICDPKISFFILPKDFFHFNKYSFNAMLSHSSHVVDCVNVEIQERGHKNDKIPAAGGHDDMVLILKVEKISSILSLSLCFTEYFNTARKTR